MIFASCAFALPAITADYAIISHIIDRYAFDAAAFDADYAEMTLRFRAVFTLAADDSY